MSDARDPKNPELAGQGGTRQFRAAMRAKYSVAFRLHADVARRLEPAVETRRRRNDEIDLAADMLMVQAYKAHLSVYVLAELAQVEDAATIARRLLELAVQAGYIVSEEHPELQSPRAGRYLSHLWDRLPANIRQALPRAAREEWETLFAEFGRDLSPKRSRWGPSFREMFDDLGVHGTYAEDYSLLSDIAHGSLDEQVLQHSSPRVDVRPDHHVPLVLLFSSRYYLGVADRWNTRFQAIDSTELNALIECALHTAVLPAA